MDIRLADASDWPAIWALLDPVIREGEVLALPRDGGEAVARAYFASPEKTVFVAVSEGEVVGAFHIRPNQQGGGAHIANCGYVTAPAARGHGIGRALCTYSIEECRQMGFRGIQFNFVVSTNAPAVHLWQSCGFEVIARLPGAFLHPRLGYVDALVMYLEL